MRLHEYQSKQIFSKYGVPIPQGRVASSAIEARQIAEELGSRAVVKTQVLSGGRGKAGGVLLAGSSEEVEVLAAKMLSMSINGLPVHKLLIEEAVEIQQEYYLGITIDREKSLPILIVSSQGGVDIEETALRDPGKIFKYTIPILPGLHEYQIRNLAVSIDLPKNHWRQFFQISLGLWHIFCEDDASLVEINPLVTTEKRGLIALDGKIELDENALFRHPDLAELRDLDSEDDSETEARKIGIAYVNLTGNIGCMVNGAGLAMATMDIIKHFGGEPANFLDIGGGAGSEKVAAAFRLILSDGKVKSILINIFGGITRCDEVAKGIIDGIAKIKTKIPIIIRLEGNHAKEAHELLKQYNIHPYRELSIAAKAAIDMAKQGHS